MKRFACAALVVTLGSVAHADTPKREPAPDEVADVESAEANLEPTMAQEPRKGLSLALAAGGGILMGGDIGVGRGPTFSLRLGHTATRKTNITFELVRNDALHNQKGVGAGAMEGPTLYDINVGLFAGAQHYTSRSFWLRAATGLTTFVEDATSAKGTGGKSPRVGAGALVGGGLDLARWGYFVIGFETFGMASVSGDGLKLQLSFGLGFSYY